MSHINDIKDVLHHVDAQLDHALERLKDLLKIPSISTQQKHRGDCRKAAEWLRNELETLGFDANLRDVSWAAPGHPMVLGFNHEKLPQKTRVLFYGHYDVQPIDPENLWDTPPFEPVIKEIDGRKVIIARGASDDKGQVMTFIEACRAWKEVKGALPVDVTILLEGEEECGGENLNPFLEANKNDLTADLALICDTSMVNRTTPAITTSLRGLLAEEVVIRCAKLDLHSGIYGNAATNPIAVLSTILAKIRDEDGRVVLPGFYDGIKKITDHKRTQWKKLFPNDGALLHEVGLSTAAGEKGYSAIEQVWARPTFEINGISGGYEDEGFKTVIPAQAMAKISFRLVPGQDAHKIRDSFRNFIRQNLPQDAEASFTTYGASPAFALSEHNPYLSNALEALGEEWGTEAVEIGSGGSIPVAGDVRQTLSIDALMIGFAQNDDRIHSPNEQYGIESFHKGIRSWVRILAKLAQN
ncbi:dipeptidase [Aristophania vespae]|uniref:dipeptidase n=1 Tax=Aristophania vespae TaxID=2697033 RepID=UPI0023518356|nr:dipeptidase [Aristophania vespae]UMM63175.1 Succinyl-diaminopimelate desuccinylase [Aristophania vespae]